MARKKPGPRDRDPRWTSDAEPAPGDLKLVQVFVNTAAHGDTGDELASPRALADWLQRWELPGAGAELDAADLERARTARAGVAALVAFNSGRKAAAEAVSALNRVTSETPFTLQFEIGVAGRWQPPASGLGACLGRLLAIVAAAQEAGRWPRLKVCADSACGTVYYDFSSTSSKRWCTARCGNRMSARRARRRSSRRFY